LLKFDQIVNGQISDDVKAWFNAAGLAIKASYRVDEVARLLNIGTSTVYGWIERGDLEVLETPQGQRRSPTRISIVTLARMHPET
jgi:excisionase family DNA binding protein